MTVDTLTAQAPPADPGPAHAVVSPPESSRPGEAEPPKTAPAKKATGRKSRTLELTLTVTGTPDGEWRAELRQGSAYLARDIVVAAAAVSRAAKELHADLATPIDHVIEEARLQQTARVAALEAELETARRALAGLE